MKCPRCQADTRDGVRFCEECGGRLALTCGNCGAEMLPDKRFCGACGTPVATQPVERYTSPQGYTPNLASFLCKPSRVIPSVTAVLVLLPP